MKKLVSNICVLAIAVLYTSVFSQKKQEKNIELDEVVISATKFNLKKEHTGKIIYVISQKEIQNNAGESVVELLNNIPGVEIKGSNSNASEIRGTYVRGGRSRQVLVLIDGVPVSDPTGVSQEYDLRMLSLNQIESIEVLKGASSTLYGSGAATGVINILLKKASENKVSATYEVSLGTHNSRETNAMRLLDRNQNVSINGTLSKLNYLAYFSISGIDGMSAAKSNSNSSFSNDPFYNKSGLLKIGYRATDKLSIETFLNYDAFEYSYDAGAYKDSEINNGDQKQLRFGIRPSFRYDGGEAYVLASVNELSRTLHSYNPYAKAINSFGFEGKSIHVDLVNKLDFFEEKFQLITGLNYQEHDNNTTSDFGNINSDVANFSTVDPYASLIYISDFGLNTSVGARYNMHSEYGNYLVYDASVSYGLLKNERSVVKVLATYGTSFIAPSIYQLFSQYGSVALDPETNKTFEVGVEASYQQLVQLNAVYFNRTEDNAIIFKNLFTAPWGVYDNAATTVTVSGIETALTITLIEKINIKIGYTYTDKDANADYIPKHKLTTNLEVTPFENTNLSLRYKNVGERTYFDQWGSFGTAGADVVLPTYNLLDVNANYKLLNETVTVFASVTNVFNEDYEETLGYTTRGRNFKLGVRLQF